MSGTVWQIADTGGPLPKMAPGMATAVSSSAKRAAPGLTECRGKPKTYWGSDVVLSRQGERCWHLTIGQASRRYQRLWPR
jgi:hypothetical protein